MTRSQAYAALRLALYCLSSKSDPLAFVRSCITGLTKTEFVLIDEQIAELAYVLMLTAVTEVVEL